MANFNFLIENEKYKAFADSCVEAELGFAASFKACAVLTRAALECAVIWLYNAEGIQLPKTYTLKTLIDYYEFSEIVESKIQSRLRFIIRVGNNAAHQNVKISKEDAILSLVTLFEFVLWIDYCYGDNYCDRKYDESLLKITENIKVDIEKLNAELEDKAKQNEELLAKINNLSEQLKTDRAKNQQSRTFNVDEISEYETRKRYIDFDIIDAGFTFDKDCITEVEVSPMPNDENKGYVDYVLYGDNKKPIAIIEAKRTSISLEKGVHQAKLYADALEIMFKQRPVIFLANGYEAWLWDDGAGYPRRPVYAVFTKDEIQLLIQRRTSRLNLDKIVINNDITDRYYQKLAVKEACEAYKNKRRHAVWIMATGSGKTRTAISLVDVLSKCNWVKNTLFLADRIELVKQAKKSFINLLPQASVCNLLDDKDKDNKDARIIFSTYQTIMNAIDNEKTEDGNRLFTPAHFDLIIIDEAHRSIFRKYRSIFSYFDAMLLGMTATPKSDVDKNTYDFFKVPDKLPTYNYPFETAVFEDKVLVNYHCVEIMTRFTQDGIIYDELSEEDKAIYEETFGDGTKFPENISAAALNAWLFNIDTIDKVIVGLMERGIKVEGGDKLGKTIIFAANKDHAKIIKERFDVLYPSLSGSFAAEIYDGINYASDLITNFKEPKKYPQVAISVDMLDTGIDVPEIVNLVYFKKVRSKAKFWQMLGRGTRLCKDLLDIGKDKKEFYIFDYCGNFEFFSQRKNEIQAKNVIGTTERIFITKAHIVMMLQDLRFADEKHQEFRNQLIEDIIKSIKALPMANFAVKEQRLYVEKYSDINTFTALSDNDIINLTNHIGYLIISTDPDDKAKSFDLSMYLLMFSVLNGEEKIVTRIIKRTMNVAKDLSKNGTMPQIKAKKEIIEQVQTSSFWDGGSFLILKM